MRKAAATPPELLRRLAISAGEKLILVGGQSLAYWVGRFNLRLPAGVATVSNDVDFLSDAMDGREAVHRLAEAMGGKAMFPSRRALTALVGIAERGITDSDSAFSVDVLSRIVGPTRDAVRKRAVRVELEPGDPPVWVMHPLDVLHSRLANLQKLPSKQDDKGRMQLALAIDVAREFLREQAAARPVPKTGRHPMQGYVGAIERLALSDAGRKVARRHGLHVADAIDPALIPSGLFWTKRWPQIRSLMSPDYAAGFAPPGR